VTPIDPSHRLDADEILDRSAALDQLADMLDQTSFDDCTPFDPALPEQLRDHAEIMDELAGRIDTDPARLVAELATFDALTRIAGSALARLGVRDLLGRRGYRRVEHAALSISELSSCMFERSLDPALTWDISAYDHDSMRRIMRAIAAGYSWSQQMADASVSLARPLARSLARHLAAVQREPGTPLRPDRFWPTTDALLHMHGIWLNTLDAPMRAELDLARSSTTNQECFDVGTACSIARRLLVHAAGESHRRVPDTSHPGQWLRLLGPV
jgi:hypothetical protein